MRYPRGWLRLELLRLTDAQIESPFFDKTNCYTFRSVANVAAPSPGWQSLASPKSKFWNAKETITWQITFSETCRRPSTGEATQLCMMTTGPDPTTFYAYESADPVEALSFDVNGIAMSDFVYPSYFEDFRQPNSVQFDQMNRVSAPFQILHGGYQLIFKDGQWSQTFAFKDEAKRRAFAREDRRRHRSEQRTLRVSGRLEFSEPAMRAA